MNEEPDIWNSRDLPVLREITRRLAANPAESVHAHEVAHELDLDVHDTRAAVVNLVRGGHVLEPPNSSRRSSARRGDAVVDITDQALYVTGVWPTPETALERMIAALESIAENTDDEDTRTRARRLLDGLASGGRTIGLSVATAAITGQLPS